jgi:hypothetical protein
MYLFLLLLSKFIMVRKVTDFATDNVTLH